MTDRIQIFTIRDQVAGFFMPPFTAPNIGVAKRMFIGSMGDSFPHRAGFSLHMVGEFDTEDGVLTQTDPILVLSGTDIDWSLDPRPGAGQQELQS